MPPRLAAIGHLVERPRSLRVEVDNDDVRRLLFERLFELGLVRGPRGAHRDAAIAQNADDLLGLLDGVFDQQQLDDVCRVGSSGNGDIGGLSAAATERAAIAGVDLTRGIP